MYVDEFDGTLSQGWYFDDTFNDMLYACSGHSSTPEPSPDPCSTIDTATPIIIDHDTFKSEAPSKTVIASNTLGAKSFFDLKVHATDARTEANQKLLVQTLIGPNTKTLLTENIYPRRDLTIEKKGWTHLLRRFMILHII